MSFEQDAGTTPWVFRCADCGDTFPSSFEEAARCPSCGSENVETATEPML